MLTTILMLKDWIGFSEDHHPQRLELFTQRLFPGRLEEDWRTLASYGIDAGECLIVRHLGAAQQQTSSELAAERQQRQHLEVRMREILREVKEYEQMRLCTICMDRTRQVALQPCFHLVACEQCSARLMRCPICLCVIHGRFSVRVP